MRTVIIAAASLLLLTGCGATSIYRQPLTGDVKTCERPSDVFSVEAWTFGQIYDSPVRGLSPYNRCKNALEASGYERVEP